MKILVPAIVIGPLLLMGVLPAAAQPGAPAAAATASGSTADRDAYLQKARHDMRIWGQKLHDLGTDAAVKGREGGTAAEKELDLAWTQTKAASHRLGTASAEGWDGAKASFESASRHLDDTWHKVHPEDK